jgi:hypothetical protein
MTEQISVTNLTLISSLRVVCMSVLVSLPVSCVWQSHTAFSTTNCPSSCVYFALDSVRHIIIGFRGYQIACSKNIGNFFSQKSVLMVQRPKDTYLQNWTLVRRRSLTAQSIRLTAKVAYTAVTTTVSCLRQDSHQQDDDGDSNNDC